MLVLFQMHCLLSLTILLTPRLVVGTNLGSELNDFSNGIIYVRNITYSQMVKENTVRKRACPRTKKFKTCV